jgi:hypothetical protein
MLIRRTTAGMLLRRLTLLLFPPALLLMFVLAMLLQFVELQDRNEVISTGIVIALFSMSALSFGWNRSLSDLGDRQKLGPRIHYAGEGLFIAALLALVALFFIAIKLPPSMVTPWITNLLFSLHWVFLLLAMIYAVQAVWDLFKVAMSGPHGGGGEP